MATASGNSLSGAGHLGESPEILIVVVSSNSTSASTQIYLQCCHSLLLLGDAFFKRQLLSLPRCLN